MAKNVFVLGLLDWQRKELESIDHADQCRFLSLLSAEELVEDPPGFKELLVRARRQLTAFDGRPDAIVCHWDFPSSCLAPVLAGEFGLRCPSLEAVLKCEHKYWARLEQSKVAPECVPDFQALDPFDPDAAQKLQIDFPIWLKPIKAFSSQLGFEINDRDELSRALAEMRESIGEIGNHFDECLAHTRLPEEVAGIGGRHALAESLMNGVQHAPEGHVFDGEICVHGTFEMVRRQNGREISHLRYPSTASWDLQDRMNDICRRVIGQAGFDDGCFNIEFLWDESLDKLWIIEINTRISQAHSDLLYKVDGVSNHEVAVAIALGERPHLPRQRGRFPVAAAFRLNKTEDAEVVRVPTPEEIEEVSRELDGALIELRVEEGLRLSDLPNQSAYAYTIGEAWIGAESDEELLAKFDHCSRALPIRFSDGKGLTETHSGVTKEAG